MTKKLIISAFAIVIASPFVFAFWLPFNRTIAQYGVPFADPEPDLPGIFADTKQSIGKEEFLLKRNEAIGLKRGIRKDKPVDPQLRPNAIVKMQDQEEALRSKVRDGEADSLLLAAWSPIGPNPIVSGLNRYSGRVISIAVHPSNPNLVYAGAAQGGLYRSSNGGTDWTPLMDGAQSIAIGAIAISPSNPETVYVGTGEHNFSLDSFSGVGVYKITNASTTATLTGPLNKDAGGADIFTGRGISRIIVDPTDSAKIFVATTSGLGGIGGVTSVFPSRGIYRSTNATSASPTFTKLTGLAGGINASVRDIAIDPGDPNIMVAGLVASGGTGGIYRSTNALSATPTFTQVEVFSASTTSELTTEFAAI
ncbi:MAG: hypothetical protein OEM82_05795, partial [Acidobacteriota bacterium]|nr:hypothetical protein [Acidobacteriota bacterium]